MNTHNMIMSMHDEIELYFESEKTKVKIVDQNQKSEDGNVLMLLGNRVFEKFEPKFEDNSTIHE